MKLIETTVAELVAFTRCEHKFSLDAKPKSLAPPAPTRAKEAAALTTTERKRKIGCGR